MRLSLVLLVSLLLLTHPVRVGVKAAAMLLEVLDAPLRPLDSLAPRPRFEMMPLQLGDLGWDVHLYLPTSPGRHGALILEVAISPEVVRHPQAVALAQDLARVGLVVALIDSPFLTRYRLTAEELDVLVGSFRYLQGRPEVDPRRIALGGFSAGGSMALLGAADPRIAQEVAAVLSFGGFYDVTRAVEAVLRGEVDGRPWAPHPTSVYTFRLHLVEQVGASADVRRHLLEGGPPPVAVSPREQVLLELLERPPADAVPALRELLPPRALEETRRLSPREQLHRLRAPIFLMHDRDDSYIPVSESRALAAEARRQGRDILYVEFSFFEHVQPLRSVDAPTRLAEALKLGWMVYRFLGVVA